jgi:hypothetical protein
MISYLAHVDMPLLPRQRLYAHMHCNGDLFARIGCPRTFAVKGRDFPNIVTDSKTFYCFLEVIINSINIKVIFLIFEFMVIWMSNYNEFKFFPSG